MNLKIFAWWLAFPMAFNGHAQLKAFTENWAADVSPNFGFFPHDSSHAYTNKPNADAGDGKALQLMLAKDAKTAPGGGAGVQSNSSFLYGTFTARLKTADCSAQPNAGVVTGYFTYFNDGSDKNGDGLPDNSEIDFEWLCAEPQTIYLTLWTDFLDGTHQKRLSRVLNLATGKIASTQSKTSWGSGPNLTGVENQPDTLTALPGYNSSAAFYDYGISWSADRVLWWMKNPKDGSRITLWDYRGPAARIPARSSKYQFNVWHSSTWTPDALPSATQAPAGPISAYVDWAAFDLAPVPLGLRVTPGISPSLIATRPHDFFRFDARGRRADPAHPCYLFGKPTNQVQGAQVQSQIRRTQMAGALAP